MSANAAIPAGTNGVLPVTSADATAPARRWSRRVASDTVAVIDGLAVALGAALPVTIYWIFGGLEPNWILTVQSGIVAAAITVFLLRDWGMYDTARLAELPENPGRLLAALALALVAVMGLGLPYAIQDSHLWVWYAAWASASYTMLLANRGVSRYALKLLTSTGRFDQRVAVYGAGTIARRVHDHLTGGRLGIHFIGVFDDRADDSRINPEGLSVAGKLADLIEAAASGRVDQIIIALPQGADSRMTMIARTLERLPVSVHIVTHIASDLVDNDGIHKVSSLGPVGMLDVKRKALSDWQPIVKRAVDLGLGSVLLVLSLPILAVAAVAIAVTSAGPIFIREDRRGLHKSTISVVRLRTKKSSTTGVVSAAQGDDASRLTSVGKVLRRFGIDELPLLWNVVTGDMSLVGPRLPVSGQGDDAAAAWEVHANRHQLKPGLTSLADVERAGGSSVSAEVLERRLASDLAYMKDWSVWLDLKVIARTVLMGLSGGHRA
ncbi:MAG: sugar transferase [Hyphomicrobiaceae bacterium]|nr:sugar transferase [Hyphomicrobiaceae bacterium]